MKQLHIGGGAFKTTCNESNVGKRYFVQAKLVSAGMTEHLEGLWTLLIKMRV